jgi:hypothetical protein
MDSRSLFQNGLRTIIACAAVCMFFLPVKAQYRVSSSLFKPRPTPPSVSFLRLPDSLKADSSMPLLASRSTKSPTTAILLSAVLPGAGQIYTGGYWKVPIILGFGGYFAYEWTRMEDHYSSARSKYTESVVQGENGGLGNAQFLYERDFYHDERDRFAFYLAITYLLNIVDAYVGASLYNFDVGDNLTGGTSLKISIPFH